MKIGIIGSGNIGKTLARKLSAKGHDVLVANSRSPDTIDREALEFGARPVTAVEAVKDVDVVILSVPLARIPDLKGVFETVPPETVVIDTSNYYPFRDSNIAALDQGQIESLWVSEQLGRPVVKAWNAILADPFRDGGHLLGMAGRLAIPVAADSEEARRLGMTLVDDTGFDPFDAGRLADSWRFQPGQPAYCTGLTADAMGAALEAADHGAPNRRDEQIRKMLDQS